MDVLQPVFEFRQETTAPPGNALPLLAKLLLQMSRAPLSHVERMEGEPQEAPPQESKWE